MLKKKTLSIVVTMLVLALIPLCSWAGNGKGPGDGTGPIHNIYDGTPFDIVGEVIEITQGAGLTLATDAGNVIVYGIGPQQYWDSLSVLRPAIGDTIEVRGYAVDYNGTVLNIATEILTADALVPLRDADTGLPLWLSPKKSR